MRARLAADDDRLLSVPVARIPMHDDAALRILNVIILYIKTRGRGDFQEDPVRLTFNARIHGYTQTIPHGQIAARDAGLNQAAHTANVCVLNGDRRRCRHCDRWGFGICALPVPGVGAALR